MIDSYFRVHFCLRQFLTLEANQEASKFSVVMADLPTQLAKQVRKMTHTVKDEDLADFGRETHPHVTVKYGFHTDDPKIIRRALDKFSGPIQASLGKTSVFDGDKSGKPFDVLKIDVNSKDLHELNALLAKGVDHTDTHPEYHPHVTIAYLKPGAGKKYAGQDDFDGTKITFDKVVFSTTDHRKYAMPLN